MAGDEDKGLKARNPSTLSDTEKTALAIAHHAAGAAPAGPSDAQKFEMKAHLAMANVTVSGIQESPSDAAHNEQTGKEALRTEALAIANYDAAVLVRDDVKKHPDKYTAAVQEQIALATQHVTTTAGGTSLEHKQTTQTMAWEAIKSLDDPERVVFRGELARADRDTAREVQGILKDHKQLARLDLPSAAASNMDKARLAAAALASDLVVPAPDAHPSSKEAPGAKPGGKNSARFHTP